MTKRLLDFTLQELLELEKEQKDCLTIQDWKVYVSEFRDKHDLTDKEAVDLAHFARDIAPKIKKWIYANGHRRGI